MSKYKKINIFFLLFVLSVFCTKVFAQTQSGDAIAVRVLPNPNHYSAARWYQEQGFSGSPQSLIVDGYEAVRDGRTVYVNAGNVVGSVLYTNIYLLSFNQEAQDATVDIFSRILSRWKFNTNYLAVATCSTTNTTNCLYSEECPNGEYCTSSKSKMIRDTRRLADLAEIKILLENYKKNRGIYPLLNSGTYVIYHSVSTWPSWQKLLAQHLGQEIPVDPINKLGDCGDPRFDPVTCWDSQANEFADGDTTNTDFDLPANSHAYVYVVSADGLRYSLTGNLEEGYGAASTDSDDSGGTTSLSGAGSISGGETSATAGSADHAPSFTGESLFGKSGEVFNGYIGVYDRNPTAKLKVTIDTSGTAWTAWSAAPTIESVPSVNSQRKITASVAGIAGTYDFVATVNNGLGLPSSITTKTFTISIENDPPMIGVRDYTYLASTTNPLDVSFQVKDAVSNYPLTYTITPDGKFGLKPATFKLDGSGLFYVLNLNGYFNPLTESPIDTTKDYNFVVTATDAYGAVGSDSFTITVKNNKPIIDLPLPCATQVRVGNTYPSCKVTAHDPDRHAISYYSFSSLPAGMTGSAAGVISGTPPFSEHGDHDISITATDIYGAVSISASYALNVNTYCGDGVKQGVGEEEGNNMENTGGPSGNGVEDCDGTSGLAISPADSNKDRMYACTSLVCPVGSSCVGACTYLAGPNGGFCGDGITQNGTGGTKNFGEQCDDGMDASMASGTDRCDTRNVNGYGYCAKTFCGDGVVQSPNGANVNETCDEGSDNGKADGTCYANCALSYCGDGILQKPNGYGTDEDCDNGASNANTSQCNLGCKLTYCGDGIVQSQNGVHLLGTDGKGHEVCDGDTCGAGNKCVDCACQCIPCEFDSTNFDQCCFQ